ncbi:MAG TPA: long-chain fatty acid--CoA ligase [Polyangia bacterium]|nr:long-chain fatty acid--CoA ligase [Polyangia bacterium]
MSVETFNPKYTDLGSMLAATAARWAEEPFLGEKRDGAWRWVTFGEFHSRVKRARAALAGLGVAKGDRVAVISNNRIEWAECAYAAWTLGATYVPMYEVQLEADWRHILADCGARVCLVSTDAILAKVSAMRDSLPALERIVGFDRPDGDDSYRALCAAAGGGGRDAVTLSGGDDAVFIYTSGTTGKPKGVRLSHQSLTANICATEGMVSIGPGDRGLCILPWAHVGGLAELNTLVLYGVSAGLCQGFDKLAENLVEVKPTWLIAVPRIWHKFHDAVQKSVAQQKPIIQRIFRRAMSAGRLRRERGRLTLKDRVALAVAERVLYPKIRARLGGRLRLTTVGAAALSIDVAHFIENLGIPVLEVYGQTECSPLVTGMRPGDGRLGSVGRPLPGVTVKLDHDAPGGDAENGEIIVYGHCVMLGYHRLPEESARVFTSDGGLRTGDLGRLDGDGFLYITGRVKEVYKLDNGKFVAPVPIEEKIALSPYVAQAMVVGLNRPHNVALIVVDRAALLGWCAQQGLACGDDASLLRDARVRRLFADELARLTESMKGYERVGGFVLTTEEMTTANDLLTPTLKVKRRNVLAKYGDQLEALYR